MTVGKFGKGEVAAKKAMLEKDWKEWVVHCDGIHIRRIALDYLNF